MAVIDVVRAIENGTVLDLNNGASTVFKIKRRSFVVLKFYTPYNNVATFNISITGFSGVMEYKISFYRFNDKNVLVPDGVSISYEITNAIQKELRAGNTYIQIETSSATDITGSINAKTSDYVPIVTLPSKTYFGGISNVDLLTKPRPRVCDKPLLYELLDGSLPDGLVLLDTGEIIGTVANMDCLEDSNLYPPSFNWFTDNHDDVAQAWGRIWRFKVRLSLVEAPEFNTEKWFCVKVFNNWNLDRDKFTSKPIVLIEESVKLPASYTPIPQHIDLICNPCKPIVEFIPQPIKIESLCGIKPLTSGIEIDGIFTPLSEIEYKELGDCVSCKDPTRQKDIEVYNIPMGAVIRTPDEFLRYYINHQDVFDFLIMELHNSLILPEILENLKRDKRNRTTDYEIKIHSDKIELIRYHSLKTSAFGDIDEEFYSHKNIINQIAQNESYGYYGFTSRGILTW